MPAALDPDKRAAIVDAIKAGGHRNAIARQHEVALSTVTRIAQQDGIEDAFDRGDLKKATEAQRADNAAEAIGQAKRWHTFSAKLLGRLDEATDEQWQKVPLLDIAKIAGIAVDKGIALQRVGDPEADTSQTLVAELLHGLRARVTTDG